MLSGPEVARDAQNVCALTIVGTVLKLPGVKEARSIA